MKIDRTKLKKSSSEVPADCKGLIDRLASTASKAEFLVELQRIETWTYGKCELLHWIDVLDRCDEVLEAAAARPEEKWALAVDAGDDRLKELVLWTLHFTTLLIEHSFSRHLYSSMEHLTTLLASSDLDIVLAVLNLLYMFSKRSNFIARLAVEKRAGLLTRLTHLAAGWGGKDNGFGLSKCCADDPIETFPESATTLHFEFYAESKKAGSTKPGQTVITVIHMPHVDQQALSPAALMEKLLATYNVPEEKQMQLFTYLRLASSFSNYSKRLKCVQARLQALSVLIYSNTLTENVQSLLYSGLLEELVEVLEQHEHGDHLMEIKAAALKALTSIIHLDRNPNYPKLNTIIDVTGASSYHGFLPVMVRNCIASLTQPKQQPFPQPLATALFSFLYHLASFEAGGEALVSCGMMESLLKVIQWPSTELDHITFVTRAVRVIDLITNLDMQSFQTHQGLASFIKRLELEVEHCRKQQPFQIQVGPVRRDSLADAIEQQQAEEEAAAMETRNNEAGEAAIGDEDVAMEEPAAATAAVATPPEPQPILTSAMTDENKELPDYSAAKTGLTCLPQRAALLKSMLNFLKKAIQDQAFSDSIRHVMDGSLPNSLKHIISNAEYYGPSLFLLATDVVTAYVFQEPSLLSSLQDNGLTDVVLHALLVKDVPATREVLGSLPNVFSALCLNTRGLEAFVACKPFERLFKVLLSPDYLPAMRRRRSSDSHGDTASNLGNAMDELMRHQPSLKTAATGAIIKLLEEVCALGRDPKYICWKTPNNKTDPAASAPIEPANGGNAEAGGSSDEEDEEEEVNVNENQDKEQNVPTNQPEKVPAEKMGVPLVDYIHNVMKFVDAILSNNSTDDHCREFVLQNGLVPLMGILGLPNLPIDFPTHPACQAVSSVSKSILNLAHEPQVLKQGLLHLNDVLKSLEPLHKPLEPPGGSVLLHELVSANGIIGDATSNPQATPLLHHMSAAHAYIHMFITVCRTGQSDIRTISVGHWGSDLGLNVLKGLSRLYTSLVWESTVLLALCSEDTLPPGCEFGKADMDKLLPPATTTTTTGAATASASGSNPPPTGSDAAAPPKANNETEETFSPSSGTSGDSSSSVTVAMENLSTDPDLAAMEVDSNGAEGKAAGSKEGAKQGNTALHHQIKQIKPLLSGSSRLGRALAELFALLVKLCVGSPLRQRRGQQIPAAPAPPSPPARAVASALTKLLASGLSWEPPSTSPIPKFRLTFFICSVGFTSPMLFDEKKFPFHLMLQKFLTSGGQRAFFDAFYWALSIGYTIPPEDGLENPELPDGTGEFLDSWLLLLEKMVNPKNVLESPHTLPKTPSKSTGNNYKPFDKEKYLTRTHKLAFQAVMKLWGKKPLKTYGPRMSDSVLAILCHILKGEKMLAEKEEKEKSTSTSSDPLGGGRVPTSLVPHGIPPLTSAAALQQDPPQQQQQTSTSSSSGVSITGTAPPASQATQAASTAAADPTTSGQQTAATSEEAGGSSASTADNSAAAATTASSGEPSGLNQLGEVAAAAAAAAASAFATTTNPQPPQEPDVNQQDVSTLMDMGFPRERAIEALQSTNSLDQATDYLLNNPLPPLRQPSLGSRFAPPSLGQLGAAFDFSSGEQDDLMRAIAMSLGENVIVSTDPANPEAASGEAKKEATASEAEKEDEDLPIEEYEPVATSVLDDFAQNALTGCLTLLDALPDTVYKVCDLLIAVFNRNGADFKESILKTLIQEVHNAVIQLSEAADGTDAGDSFVKGVLAARAAVRIHLFTLLFEECKILCAKIVEESKIVSSMTHLLATAQNVLQSLNSSTTDPNLNLTPKWMTPLLLFIDLHEKVVLGMNRRSALETICSHTWKWFDVSSGKWCSYAQANNKTIDDAFWAGEASVRIQNGRRKYTIQFGSMMQANEETGNRRPVMISLVEPPKKEESEKKKEDDEKAETEDSKTGDKEKSTTAATTPQDPMDQTSASSTTKSSLPSLQGLSEDERSTLLRASVTMMGLSVDSDALNAILRLLLRLTQNFEQAVVFAQLGGVKMLLDLTQASSFSGFSSLATLLIRHVMEDEVTLRQTMEKVIRSSTINSSASNTKELHYLLRMLAPAACRSPSLFAEVAREVLRVDFNLLKKTWDQDEDKRLLLKSLPPKSNVAPSNMASMHEVSTSVISDLLNFLVRTTPALTSEKPASDEANVSEAEVGQKQNQANGANRTQAIVRNSSSGELQVSVPEGAVPPSGETPSGASTSTKPQQSSTGSTNAQESSEEEIAAHKKRPLMTKATVCRLLAELVKSYGNCAKLITDHVYEAGMSELVKEDTSALAFLLDELLIGKTNSQDKECSNLVKTLVAALASCNHYPEAQTALVTEVKGALARALALQESSDKHAKIQALTSLICTMIESCPSSQNQQMPMTIYRQLQCNMNNMVKIMLKKGIINDLARVSHSLDLSSPNVAATINTVLKPLETLSRIVNQPTGLGSQRVKTSKSSQQATEPESTADTAAPNTAGGNGTNTTNSEATRAQGDETVEPDAEATEHDISTAAESIDPNSESQLHTVEEGNDEEFDDMMDQLLERDAGAPEIIAEAMEQHHMGNTGMDSVLDDSHNDSQMMTQDESQFEAQQMSQDEEDEDHESESSHSSNFEEGNEENEDGMDVEGEEEEDEDDEEDEDEGEDDDEDEDEDDDDDEGGSPFADQFQELEDAIYRFPLGDAGDDDMDLMIHYSDPEAGGLDSMVDRMRAIHLPLWSDAAHPAGADGLAVSGSGVAGSSHVSPNHPLLMGRQAVEASGGSRNPTRSIARQLHRGFRGTLVNLNSRGGQNPSAPTILQNFLGANPQAQDLLHQGLRRGTPLLVDFGYAILDSLENELPDVDNSIMGSGGRAALSTIPSALVRWNEESRVIDGDSMHDCVTALKPKILEVIEKVRDDESAERRAKKKQQEEEEEAKRKAADEAKKAAAAAAKASSETPTPDAQAPTEVTNTEVVTTEEESVATGSTTAATAAAESDPPMEEAATSTPTNPTAAQMAQDLAAAISSRITRSSSGAGAGGAGSASTSAEAAGRPPTTSEEIFFRNAISSLASELQASSSSPADLPAGNMIPPPFPTLPVPPASTATNSERPTESASNGENSTSAVTNEQPQPPPQDVSMTSEPEQPPPQPQFCDSSNNTNATATEPEAQNAQGSTASTENSSANVENGTASTSSDPGAGPSGTGSSSGPDYSSILGIDVRDLPEGVDPSFLAALPEDMRQEVIDEQRRLQTIRQRAAQQTEAGVTEVNPEFLAALPPNIQEEVLAQQRIEQQRQATAANPEAPVDPGEFLQTLPASLRQTVLADMEESQIPSLPAELAAEAQTLRRELEQQQRNRIMMHERYFNHSSSTLSSILRNTVSRMHNGRDSGWRTAPFGGRGAGGGPSSHAASSLLASANALRVKGRQLLDHEGLSCLLIILFIDDSKINMTRLHRILRNLCYHAPTREWVVKCLLSILEKSNDKPPANAVTEIGSSCFDTPPSQPPAKIRKSTSKSGQFSSSETSTPSSNSGSSKVDQKLVPSWLNISMDAALGFRANVFQVTRVVQSGGKKSSNSLGSGGQNGGGSSGATSSTISIHPGASSMVCKHSLEVLISLAKSFSAHFLPWKDQHHTSTSSKDKEKEDKPASKTAKSIDFWDTLLKLDQQSSSSKKGKSVARSHSSAGSLKSAAEELSDEAATASFEHSPFGQLLCMLACPVIRRNSVLTDKLLRLLSLISLGQPEILKKKDLDKDEKSSANNQAIKSDHLKLAVEVLTSKSCSEEGLEDVTALLLNLSYGPEPTRDTILNLLLQGAQELGNVVRQNIIDLQSELRALKKTGDEASGDQDGSKVGESSEAAKQQNRGAVIDRFTKEAVMVAPTKVKSGAELQLAAMNALTNKTSSQAFFLRVLKVIIQLRDAALQSMKKSKMTAKMPPVSEASESPPATEAMEVEEENKKEESKPETGAEGSSSSKTDNKDKGKTASTSVSDSSEPEALDSLSEQLLLTNLWDTLSSCLRDLSDTPDHHAVLVLQATVEAFFLVHAAPTQPDDKKKIQTKETRQEQLAHIQEQQPVVLGGAESNATESQSSGAAASGSSTTAASTSGTASTSTDLAPDTQNFLAFAETHRTVLNQILRQSTLHLADGPFSVLVDHTRVLDFDIKRRYFRTELERMDEGMRREDLAVHVRRENVFEDSFRELHRRSSEEWKNRFYIVFEGEEGQDAGGLLREWYVIISKEIFNPMYALFKTSPGDKVTYMIYEQSQTNPNHLDYFKFVGRVIAKAIYDNKHLECYFTRSFYKHILAKYVKYTDMESEDYAFYKGLEFLMNNTVEDLGYELTFSTEIREFGVLEVRDLIPNGRNVQVTEANKMDYVRLVCQMKMTGAIRKQLSAFLEGFYNIIPRRLISIFNEQELELLVSGLPVIDIDDLKANTEYHKYQSNSLQIVWFWRALRSFDQTDKAKFLQFVTGSSKVPLQGFAALEGMNGAQKFQIHRDDRSTDRLPSAHTCFNQLDLPAYETYDKLKTQLTKATQECSEGFGFA